jgi:transcriptional regulator with XRE-family HTH domain
VTTKPTTLKNKFSGISISGLELAKRREKAGFTQDQLAENLGKNRVTIARWEKNASVKVSIEDLNSIKKLLNVTTEELQKNSEGDILDNPLVKNYVEHIALQKELIDFLKKENATLRRRLGE